MLSYEKLPVYQCSVSFLQIAIELIAKLPQGNAALEFVDEKEFRDHKDLVENIVAMLSTLSRTEERVQVQKHGDAEEKEPVSE